MQLDLRFLHGGARQKCSAKNGWMASRARFLLDTSTSAQCLSALDRLERHSCSQSHPAHHSEETSARFEHHPLNYMYLHCQKQPYYPITFPISLAHPSALSNPFVKVE